MHGFDSQVLNVSAIHEPSHILHYTVWFWSFKNSSEASKSASFISINSKPDNMKKIYLHMKGPLSPDAKKFKFKIYLVIVIDHNYHMYIYMTQHLNVSLLPVQPC